MSLQVPASASGCRPKQQRLPGKPLTGTDDHLACFSLPETDFKLFFSNRRDAKTGLHLGICSLLMRYFLPLQELQRFISNKRNAVQTAEAHANSTISLTRCHATGSSVEGLSVPPYKFRGDAVVENPQDATKVLTNAFFDESSDVDVMTEITFLPVNVCPEDGRLYMEEASASHVGYTRVVLHGSVDTYSLSWPAETLCETVNGINSVKYLSNEQIKEYLVQVAERHAETSNDLVQRTGPAVNIDHINSPEDILKPDVDIVTALPLNGHPGAFHRWLHRVSGDGVYWPSKELRREIEVSAQCFLVGTGHQSSENRSLEWRLSFSDPEKRLAQSLTIIQRKVYLLLKLVQKCFLKQPKVVVTYHLKTLLFWELEQSTPECWVEQNVFECLLRLIDRLESCLEYQRIPSYFYPENNLLSHADPANVREVLATVHELRRRPLFHLYEADARVWFGCSTLVPLRGLHEPVLQVLTSELEADEVRQKLGSCLRVQAYSGTPRDLLWFLRCSELLRDSFALKQQNDLEVSAEGANSGNTNRSYRTPKQPTDWITLGTIGVFSKLLFDENAWLKVVTGLPTVPDTFLEFMTQGSKKTESTDQDSMNVIYPFPYLLTAFLPHFNQFQLCNDMMLTCTQLSSPLEPMMVLKYCKMVMKEVCESKQRAEPAVSAKLRNEPKPSAGVEDAEGNGAKLPNHDHSCNETSGKIGMRRSSDSVQKCQMNESSPLDSYSPGHGDESESIDCHQTGVEEKVTSRQGSVSSSSSSTELSRDRETSRIRKFVQPIVRMASVASSVSSEHSDIVSTPKTTASSARLVVSMMFREVYGPARPQLVRLHGVILDIIGWLRLHRHRHMACRCTMWLHQLTVRHGAWGDDSDVIVDLKCAPWFVESLSAAVQGVLNRNETCRVTLLPLTTFLVCLVMTDDKRFLREVFGTEIGAVHLNILDRAAQTAVDRGDELSDELAWTTVVLKLEVWRMTGRNVDMIMRKIACLRATNSGKEAYVLQRDVENT